MLIEAHLHKQRFFVFASFGIFVSGLFAINLKWQPWIRPAAMAVADHHSAAGGEGDETNKANLHTAEMLCRSAADCF